jgi:hypothetical protein
MKHGSEMLHFARAVAIVFIAFVVIVASIIIGSLAVVVMWSRLIGE